MILTGLDGGHLLGFLAALGTLRTLRDLNPRLGWVDQAGWKPELMLDLTPEQLVSKLRDKFQSDKWPWPLATEKDSNKLDPVRFRGQAELLLATKSPREMEWLTCLGCDWVRNGDYVEDTAFRTMSGAGHQHFLGTMRELRDSTSLENLSSALFQAWTYADEKPSLRFDPADDRRHALRWTEPSKDPIRTVRGANRLAVEALPMFFTAPDGRALKTVGFRGSKARDTQLTWPIWTAPIGYDAVKNLLCLAELQSGQPDRRALAEMGVAEVYRANRLTIGKMRNFAPASPA